MFSYQKGEKVEIYDSKLFRESKEEDKNRVKIVGGKREFSNDLKTFILEYEGTKGVFQCPRDERKELGLVQHYLVFQIFLAVGAPVNLDLNITDVEKGKRRINLTSAITKKIDQQMFFVKIPIEPFLPIRGEWINLYVDLLSFMPLFKGKSMRSLDQFVLTSSRFKIRSVYTVREPPPDYMAETGHMKNVMIRFGAQDDGTFLTSNFISGIESSRDPAESEEAKSKKDKAGGTLNKKGSVLRNTAGSSAANGSQGPQRNQNKINGRQIKSETEAEDQNGLGISGETLSIKIDSRPINLKAKPLGKPEKQVNNWVKTPTKSEKPSLAPKNMKIESKTEQKNEKEKPKVSRTAIKSQKGDPLKEEKPKKPLEMKEIKKISNGSTNPWRLSNTEKSLNMKGKGTSKTPIEGSKKAEEEDEFLQMEKFSTNSQFFESGSTHFARTRTPYTPLQNTTLRGTRNGVHVETQEEHEGNGMNNLPNPEEMREEEEQSSDMEEEIEQDREDILMRPKKAPKIVEEEDKEDEEDSDPEPQVLSECPKNHSNMPLYQFNDPNGRSTGHFGTEQPEASGMERGDEIDMALARSIERSQLPKDDGLGDTMQNWAQAINDRPSSPPFVNVLEINQPTRHTYTINDKGLPASFKNNSPSIDQKQTNAKDGLPRKDGEEELMEVIFDPILNCYYDPKTNSYYQLKS